MEMPKTASERIPVELATFLLTHGIAAAYVSENELQLRSLKTGRVWSIRAESDFFAGSHEGSALFSEEVGDRDATTGR
jgi:hypothetical protein